MTAALVALFCFCPVPVPGNLTGAHELTYLSLRTSGVYQPEPASTGCVVFRRDTLRDDIWHLTRYDRAGAMQGYGVLTYRRGRWSGQLRIIGYEDALPWFWDGDGFCFYVGGYCYTIHCR